MQQPKQPKTSAQIWLIHSMEVLVLGGVLNTVGSAYSAVSAGSLSWQAGLSIALSAGGAFLFNGIRGLLLNAQTIQAVQDTLARIEQGHANVTALLNQLVPFLANHTHPAPIQQQPVTPQPQVAPRQQFAAPVTTNSMVLPAVPTMLPQGQ